MVKKTTKTKKQNIKVDELLKGIEKVSDSHELEPVEDTLSKIHRENH